MASLQDQSLEGHFELVLRVISGHLEDVPRPLPTFLIRDAYGLISCILHFLFGLYCCSNSSFDWGDPIGISVLGAP